MSGDLCQRLLTAVSELSNLVAWLEAKERDSHHQNVHRVRADVAPGLRFPVAQVPNTFLSISVVGKKTNSETTESSSGRGLHGLGVRLLASR
jgi:hypothetical protein